MAKISVNNLASAIYESLKDKEGISFDESSSNIIKIMQDKHMLIKKDQVLDALQKIVDKEENTVRARISTKNKLVEKDLKEIEDFIKRRYNAGEIVLDKKENPKLLGGIKIEIKDEIIDLTLANKLHQLQNYLITN